MKCPICEQEITDVDVAYLETCVGEEYHTCKDEHHYFSHAFVYGQTEVMVQHVTIRYSHDDSKETRKLKNEIFNFAVSLYKADYEKKVSEK